MFIKLFIRILAIFSMIAMGVLARKLRITDTDSTRKMSRIIVNFFYPALIFSSLVSTFSLKSLIRNWTLPAGTIMIMCTGYLIGLIFLKIIPFRKEKERHVFLFQSAINNYSFLPIPIILMLWGNAGVAKLIFATLGSELSVWTIGILALTGNKFKRENLRHLLSVPMLAMFFAIFVIIIKAWAVSANFLLSQNSLLAEIGNSFMTSLDIFGKGTIPLAMFVAGSRMAELTRKHLFVMKQVYIIFLRLLVIPAATVTLLFLLPFENSIRLILLVVAIMPCAIASVVLSEVYDADVESAASSVLTTHLFSLITIPLWLFFFLK